MATERNPALVAMQLWLCEMVSSVFDPVANGESFALDETINPPMMKIRRLLLKSSESRFRSVALRWPRVISQGHHSLGHLRRMGGECTNTLMPKVMRGLLQP